MYCSAFNWIIAANYDRYSCNNDRQTSESIFHKSLMHLIVHIIQRSTLFHHNWLGEYINKPTFPLLISCQNLLDRSVKFPGNRTARFPIDWPGGREEKREGREGIKSVDFKCPFIPPWLRFMSSCFQSEYFEIKDPHRSEGGEGREGCIQSNGNQLQWVMATLLHNAP